MIDTNGIEKVKLGRTNLSVSRIAFGTSGLGSMPDTYGYTVEAERAHRTVEAIFDGPTNFLDTSRNYGDSERRIGDVIRARGGLPPGFVISTKLDRDPETNRFDAGRARQSLEKSLRMLGLDRVHLLHLHDPEFSASLDEVTGPNGAIAELFRIKEEGLCDAVGLAAGTVELMMPILSDWDFDALISHNRFTLLNRNAEPMFEFAGSRGIAVLNAAPYASGVLAKGSGSAAKHVYQDPTEEMLAPVRRIEAICTRYDIPPGAAALQFSLRDARITATICGVTRPERVQQTIAWAQVSIPDDAWAELTALRYDTSDPEATRANAG